MSCGALQCAKSTREILLWLKEGNRNIKFFHRRLIIELRRIFHGLYNEIDIWCNDNKDILQIFFSYFYNLFTEEEVFFHCWLAIQVPCVPRNIVEELCKIRTMLKIENTIKGMNPRKAPGLDGVHVVFFQKIWPIVQNEVTKHIIDMFVGTKDIVPFDYTILHHIPQKSKSKYLVDLWSIALCNVFYKILSKLLANKLKN